MATVQSSLVQTAVLEAGALSVGGLIAAHVLDFTGGIAAAGSLAVLGTMVIPLRRRRQQVLGYRRCRACQCMNGAETKYEYDVPVAR